MKKTLLIFAFLLSYSLGWAQQESKFTNWPGLIFREVFNDSAQVRQNSGIATGVTYVNGKAVFAGAGKILYPSQVGVQSVRIVINSLASTTQPLIKLSSTHSISASSGTLAGTGISTPVIYVNGAVSSTISAGRSEVVITTATGFNATDIQVGYIAGYLTGSIDQIEIYNRRLSEIEVYNLYANIPTYTASTTSTNWYGVKWNTTASDPTVTRIGNSALHRTLPVQSLLRGCIVNDAGNVVYYLHPTNWAYKADGTASTRDGTVGQVMVEFPTYYYCFQDSAGWQLLKISLDNIQGFTRANKFYHGAYKAALQRRNTTPANKLSSVKTLSSDYRGGGDQNWDATDSTLCGKPATAISRTNYRTYATNRGAKYYQRSYEDCKSIYRLFIVEYATRNSQAAVDTTLTAEGYRRGGLGTGVTNVTSAKWAKRGFYPIIPCGSSDERGNRSGEVSYTIVFASGNETIKVPRYRGVESAFGDIWEFIDGVNIYYQTAGEGDRSLLYVIYNQSNYVDVINSNNVLVSDKFVRTGGYTKTIIGGPRGELFSSSVGATGTTYWCDYNDLVVVPYPGLKAPLVGAAAYYGPMAGLGYVYSDHAASITSAYFGSRLCCRGL